jgi:uncharacterized membrane protein YdfJ with MMPL/SSD domain
MSPPNSPRTEAWGRRRAAAEGFGILGLAVLLDTLLVRLLLVPAALRLLGRRAWWVPRTLDRVLPAVRLRH